MADFRKKLKKAVGKTVNAVVNAASQDTSTKVDTAYVGDDNTVALCRKMATEGAVLLKNSGNVLPLKPENTVSVFGRCQLDWFFVGYGSGGDVNAPYRVDFMQGLRSCGKVKINDDLAAEYERLCRENPVDEGFWGHWPTSYDEFVLPGSLVREAAAKSDIAIVIIGRAAGEDRDNKLRRGSYYLTNEERGLLGSVTGEFRKVVVVLNCGSPLDMSTFYAYGSKISAILSVWQGGMESGNAVADLLTGKVNPSGKLTDTVAKRYEDYPGNKDFGGRNFNNYSEDIYVGYRYFETFAKGRVVYPFGYGLSYTQFSVECLSFNTENDEIHVGVRVTNTGECSGKEVVQLYFGAPNGRLGKPAKCLADFRKTRELAPNESEEFEFVLPVAAMSSYDDEKEFSYILEKGTYTIYLGTDVSSASPCGTYEQQEDVITQTLAQHAAPAEPFKRIRRLRDGKFRMIDVPTSKADLKKLIQKNLPQEIFVTGDTGYKLSDVKEGRVTLDEFVAQLSNDELEALSRGDYTMNSRLGAPGNAGVFGGVLESLKDKGIPPVTATDGPSGIRLKNSTTLLPCGTLIASSWNTELTKELYAAIGTEMKKIGSDVLLAPGMNIHRNLLCGRNFEYYSEDPLLTGLTAAAVVEGLQSVGVSACPKHFACNNQETNRTANDSRVSERALREIYLKGFEICVKKAKPHNIMTSYNKVNGVWSHYHYELCTCILRGEWGYEGNIMTDWWMRPSASPEFPALRDQAYRVRAGVNLLMPGGARTGKRKPDGTLLSTLGTKDGITLGELQQNAKYILRSIMEYK